MAGWPWRIEMISESTNPKKSMYRQDLELMLAIGCNKLGCDGAHDCIYLHSGCQPEFPTWVKYSAAAHWNWGVPNVVGWWSGKAAPRSRKSRKISSREALLKFKKMKGQSSLRILRRPAWRKQQIAELLAVTEQTVETHIKEGRLRAIILSPRCVRILDEDFQRFLLQRATIKEPEGAT